MCYLEQQMSVARANHLQSAPPIGLAVLLGHVREQRGMIPAEMARLLHVSPPTINGFESGEDASLHMIEGYIRELGVTSGELQALNDQMGGVLVSFAYDQSRDPLERSLVLDQLLRAMSGKRIASARGRAGELGPAGFEPASRSYEGRVTLTTLEGTLNPSMETYEPTFNL